MMRAIAIAVALLVAAPALAQTKPPAPAVKPAAQPARPFKPDPPGAWRYIWAGDGTSRCIGELVNPGCAIDTITACVAWHDNRLCDLATKGRISYRPDDGPGLTKGQVWRYQIEHVYVVRTRGRVCNDDRNCADVVELPGDIRVTLAVARCAGSVDKAVAAQCEKSAFGAWLYLLRRGPEGWVMMASGPARYWRRV